MNQILEALFFGITNTRKIFYFFFMFFFLVLEIITTNTFNYSRFLIGFTTIVCGFLLFMRYTILKKNNYYNKEYYSDNQLLRALVVYVTVVFKMFQVFISVMIISLFIGLLSHSPMISSIFYVIAWLSYFSILISNNSMNNLDIVITKMKEDK